LLTRLASLMHIAIEQTSDVAAAMTFQYNQEAHLLRLGTLLEERAGQVPPGYGARVLHRLLLVAAGLRATTGHIAPENPVFNVDLDQELTTLATALLASTES
jgi:hypothetical protein